MTEICTSLPGERIDIPDGKYHGVWSGAYVQVLFSDDTYSKAIKVTKSVRGINCKCGIELIDGIAFVHSTPFILPYQEHFYVQNGYSGNIAYWWKSDNRGYTCNLDDARRFTEEDMKKILEGNHQKKYTIWPCSYIDENREAIIKAVDTQYLSHEKSQS